MLSKYAKGVVAIVGAALTAALAIFPPGSTTWNLLTVVAAALTAVGVIVVPNTTPPTPPATKP